MWGETLHAREEMIAFQAKHDPITFALLILAGMNFDYSFAAKVIKRIDLLVKDPNKYLCVLLTEGPLQPPAPLSL